METLWSRLDEITGFTQAMSIAHAQEVIDDYMNDSNWRKLIRMGRSPQRMHRHVELTLLPADALCGKWTRAKKGVSETKPAFEQLTECLDVALVQEWTKQECIAMEQRGDHLKFMKLHRKNVGNAVISFRIWIAHVASTDTGGNTP